MLSLVTSGGGAQSAPTTVKLVVDSTLTPAPSAIRFADIKSVMQTGDTLHHLPQPDGTLPRPPVFYTNDDRNGDGIVGDATDDAFFYAEVRGRINFTEIAASPLLRKPSGNHHGGNQLDGSTPAPRPGNRPRASTTICSSTGSSTAHRNSAPR